MQVVITGMSRQPLGHQVVDHGAQREVSPVSIRTARAPPNSRNIKAPHS